MVEVDDHDCEDIVIETVYGNIIRQPEEFGLDEYVKVVSSRQIEDVCPIPLG
jgi:hypothetical protein